MRSRAVLLAILLILAPGAVAVAQPIQGLYVSAGAGLNIPQEVTSTFVTPGYSTGSLRLSPNLGFDLTGSVGYALGGGIRFEVEGDYIRDGVNSPPSSNNGNVRTSGVMANALYDFDIRSRYVFPYLGVGAGYMWTHLNNASFAQPGGSATGFGTNVDSGKFAVQFIAGAAFPVPGRPGLSLTAQYRLLDVTPGEKFSDGRSSLELGPQFTHTLLLGVRYAFHVAPPPAPPAPAPIAAPAPAPARSYLVFFDWDKATLTDRARQIIQAAAQASTHVSYTQLRVNGYTDTSGGAAYNEALSLRRAENVAAELVRDGVPRASIAIRGFGEMHLLVPTGPGVREPQNRRVEIIIG